MGVENVKPTNPLLRVPKGNHSKAR